MTEEEYAALPGVRWTVLKEMERSPLHYRWRSEHAREDSKELRLGRAIHCALLEGERAFTRRYVCFTGKTRQGKAWNAFKTAHPPPTEILKREEMDQVIQCAAAVRRHGVAEAYLEGTAEAAVTWIDPASGMACKARVDLVGRRHVELKTTNDLHPPRFQSLTARMGYHRQLAFHHDGLLANGYSFRGPIVVIGVEQQPPFDCIVFELDGVALDAGRADYQRYLCRVADCLAVGRWPGREPSETLCLSLPEWMLGRSELSLDGEDVF